jgi:hypothetical protein
MGNLGLRVQGSQIQTWCQHQITGQMFTCYRASRSNPLWDIVHGALLWDVLYASYCRKYDRKIWLHAACEGVVVR